MRDTFKDCIKDVRALIAFMKGRGYEAWFAGAQPSYTQDSLCSKPGPVPEVVGLILVSPPSVTQMMRYLATEDFYERGLFKARELSELGWEIS